MKTSIAAALFTLATLAATQTASAQVGEPQPISAPQQVCCTPAPATAAPAPATVTTESAPQTVAVAEPAAQQQPLMGDSPAPGTEPQDEEGWSRPVGRRFMHGFRMGWTYIMHMDDPTRENNMSLKSEFKLKSANMMLLGYEGFYRIVGHSWLNVLIVGNVTVAGLEQSKFIPAASGLLGFEFDRSFQLGVGVNVTPDAQAPTHMIAAAGWTPKVGAINTPLHFFFVPDAAGNHRMGATIGMSW